jgi:hypothetical protein
MADMKRLQRDRQKDQSRKRPAAAKDVRFLANGLNKEIKMPFSTTWTSCRRKQRTRNFLLSWALATLGAAKRKNRKHWGFAHHHMIIYSTSSFLVRVQYIH